MTRTSTFTGAARGVDAVPARPCRFATRSPRTPGRSVFTPRPVWVPSCTRGHAHAGPPQPHVHSLTHDAVLSPSHYTTSHLSAQGSAPQCSERRGPSERHAISRSIVCLFPSRANRLPIAIPCSRYAHAYSRCQLTYSCRRMPLHLMLRLGVFPLLSGVPPLMPNGTRVHDSIREGKLPPKALAHPWA